MRVQATATEDTMFPAYGAQTVHMPFGNVYTSLQTGVVDVGGERRQRLSRQQALRGRARALDDASTRPTTASSGSATSCGSSLTDEQKKWVHGCGRRGQQDASRTSRSSSSISRQAKLKAIGVKVVTDVDKSGFQQDRRSVSGQAGHGAGAARGQDQGSAVNVTSNKLTRYAEGPTAELAPALSRTSAWNVQMSIADRAGASSGSAT